MNKIIITGIIGQDFELKNVGKSSVTTISVGVSDNVKRNGKWERETDWIRVAVWGKQAENLAKYCSKKSKVLVEGKLKNKSYTNKQGQEIKYQEVLAANIEYLDPPKKQQQQSFDEHDDLPF